MNDETLEPNKNDAEARANRVIEELAKLAFANIGDFARIFPNGRVEIFDYEKANEVGAKISVKFLAGGRGKITEISLPDKDTALNLLMQHLGLIPVSRGRKPKLAETIAAKVAA